MTLFLCYFNFILIQVYSHTFSFSHCSMIFHMSLHEYCFQAINFLQAKEAQHALFSFCTFSQMQNYPVKNRVEKGSAKQKKQIR